MSRQTRRQKEKLRRRNEILAAARKVFSGKGYHNATLDDVASRAELGKGTIYWYFSSKADLFMAVLEAVAEEGLVRAREAIEKSRSCRSRIEAIAREELKHLARNQFLVRIVSSEAVFTTKEMKKALDDFVSERRRLHRELVEGVLRDGVRSGEIRKVDITKISNMLLSIFHSSAYFWMFEGVRPHPEQDARLMCNLIFEGLGRKRGRD
jgi:AcrR family transcriptional regulator